MIRWKYSRILFLFCLTVLVMPLFLLGGWYILAVDIPYIHSGHVVPVRLGALVYWAVATFFIFGFEVKDAA